MDKIFIHYSCYFAGINYAKITPLTSLVHVSIFPTTTFSRFVVVFFCYTVLFFASQKWTLVKYRYCVRSYSLSILWRGKIFPLFIIYLAYLGYSILCWPTYGLSDIGIRIFWTAEGNEGAGKNTTKKGRYFPHVCRIFHPFLLYE